MWKYKLSYTVVTFPEGKKPKTEHKDIEWESEDDFLAAADQAMSEIYDTLKPEQELIFRRFDFINPKEYFESLVKENSYAKAS